jgi:hypothetical protein
MESVNTLTLNLFFKKAAADPTNIPEIESGMVLNRAALIQVVKVTLFKNLIIH